MQFSPDIGTLFQPHNVLQLFLVGEPIRGRKDRGLRNRCSPPSRRAERYAFAENSHSVQCTSPRLFMIGTLVGRRTMQAVLVPVQGKHEGVFAVCASLYPKPPVHGSLFIY